MFTQLGVKAYEVMMNLPFNASADQIANKYGGAFTAVADFLTKLGQPLGIVLIVACGIMFMVSDKLSEKAKPWMVRIAIGAGIIGGASMLSGWIFEVTKF